MRVKYVGPHGSVQIAATGQQAARGETIEVSDELGSSLCEQAAWKHVKAARKAPVEAATTEKGDE